VRLLELFAGSRSIGKVAERRGWEVFSVDLKPFPGIDLVADINDIHVREFPFVPDAIWASPPCTTFSVMSLGHHWTRDHQPKTEAAVLGVRMVLKTLRIVRFFARCNPKLVYYIENPRGKLRKLPIVSLMPRATITYCKYGGLRMKPTDIWTNNLAGNGGGGQWRPRKACFPGNPDCHHEQCPIVRDCGVQRMKNAYERSKIPAALAREILDAVYGPKREKAR
jgi:hypothetical protein